MPLEHLELEKEYKTLKTNTDLHAGGIFFCIPYEESIIFYKNGKVEIKQRVIENFRPMDQQDLDRINNVRIIGTYRLNLRNYIECDFENFDLTGLPLSENKDIICFHTYDNRTNQPGSSIYKLSR